MRVANNTLLDYYRLATNTMLPVQFELLVNITNLANPTLTELNRRVVIAVLNVDDAPIVAGFTNSVLEHAPDGLALGTVNASIGISPGPGLQHHQRQLQQRFCHRPIRCGDGGWRSQCCDSEEL